MEVVPHRKGNPQNDGAFSRIRRTSTSVRWYATTFVDRQNHRRRIDFRSYEKREGVEIYEPNSTNRVSEFRFCEKKSPTIKSATTSEWTKRRNVRDVLSDRRFTASTLST